MAFIVAATRTAGARRGGALSGWHPVDLGARVLDNLVERSRIDPSRIDDVIMGCVYQVGEQSNNVARMSVLASNLPNSCPGTSIDRQCGSSQQAVHFAAQAVMSGSMDAVIACGVESMSRVPMGLSMSLPAKHGFGTYMSPQLQNNYPSEFSQFIGAEMMAKKYGITRNDMDEFSLRSHQRAIAASNTGNFKNEILPLKPIIFNAKTGVTDHVEGKLHTVDEGIRFDATLEGIAKIKPIQENGIITAGNASQICDGASGVLIVSERMLKEFNLTPLARIIHMSLFAGDPVIMLEEPLAGTKAALKKSNLSIHDIDLFEINEAFASVTLSWLKYTDADPEKLNVNGGAIALGHPLGASGTKLMTTLVNSLQQRKKRYGLQSMCEGGGMANMTIIENLQL